MVRTRFYGMTLAGSIALAASTVSADYKAYHGAVCQSYTGSSAMATAYSYEGATASSSDADDVGMVTCPLVRDRINSASSLTAVYVEARNQANNPGLSEFICQLNSQTEDIGGSSVDYHTLYTATTGNVQLGPFSVETSNGNEGSYSVDCYMTPGDKVYHILVNESNSAAD